MKQSFSISSLIAVLMLAVSAPVAAQGTKFPFRLNWTLYGEHAPFFVARDKGFYREEGLEVEIQEGSGSTTVAQLVANASNPVAYVDAATMMRGVGAGMPIKAVGVTLQQSPMAFIYRADAARPTKISEIKGSRIAITAGDASLAIFTAFMGKLGMKVEDVQMITVANPAAKEQAVLSKQADALLGYFMDQGPRMQLQTGVKMGWTRLYDMAGVTTLSSAIIANNDWMKDAKNQDTLRRFLRASQRGWQYSFENRDEAADMFGLGAREAAVAAIIGDRPVRGLAADDTITVDGIVDLALRGLTFPRSDLTVDGSTVVVSVDPDGQVSAGVLAQRLVSLGVAHGIQIGVRIRSGD